MKDEKIAKLKNIFGFYLSKKYIQKIKIIHRKNKDEENKKKKLKKFKLKLVVKYLKNFTKSTKIKKLYNKFLSKKCLDNSKLFIPQISFNEKFNRKYLQNTFKINNNEKNSDYLDNNNNYLSFEILQDLLIEKKLEELKETYSSGRKGDIFRIKEQDESNFDNKFNLSNSLYRKENLKEIKKEYFLNMHIYTTKETINSTYIFEDILNEIWIEKNNNINFSVNNNFMNNKYENVEFENKNNFLIIRARKNIQTISDEDNSIFFNFSIYIKWTVFLLDLIYNIDNFILENKLILNHFSYCLGVLEISQNNTYNLGKFKKIIEENKKIVQLENDKNIHFKQKKFYILNVNDNQNLKDLEISNNFYKFLEENIIGDNQYSNENSFDKIINVKIKKLDERISNFYNILNDSPLKKYFIRKNNIKILEIFKNDIDLLEFPKIDFYNINEISKLIENNISILFKQNNNLSFENYKYNDIEKNTKNNKSSESNIDCSITFDIKNNNNYFVSNIVFVQYFSWIKFFVAVKIIFKYIF